jgi:hypothetical protein
MGIKEVKEYLANPIHRVVPEENVQIEQMVDENPLLDPVDIIVDDEAEASKDQAELSAVQDALKAKEAQRLAQQQDGKLPLDRPAFNAEIPDDVWMRALDQIDNDAELVKVKVEVKKDMKVKDLRFIGARKHEFIQKMSARCKEEGISFEI